MENTKDTFNPQKEVHDAYDKFIRYTHAILHFNEAVWIMFIITGIATLCLVLFVGLSIFKNPYSLFFLIYPAFLIFIYHAHENIRESNPTAEELVKIQKQKEQEDFVLKNTLKSYGGTISLLIEEGIIKQNSIDKLKKIQFGNTTMIFILDDDSRIEVGIHNITRIIANKIVK